MEIYEGKAVASGIAAGQICIYKKRDRRVERRQVEDTDAEYRRVQEACTEAKRQLKELYDKAFTEAGESGAQIFEAHRTMLDDLDYLQCIKRTIAQQRVNAEYAVARAGDEFSGRLAATEDAYLSARAADVGDISERLIGILSGKTDKAPGISGKRVIFAEELSPGETMQFPQGSVLAFVTRRGGANSHAAILARIMNIPALTGVDFDGSEDGKQCIVDGFEGRVLISPDEKTINTYERLRRREKEKLLRLQELKGKENRTRSGKTIEVCANIGNLSDLAGALESDAGGIGLFRSEFLYLGRDSYPTEEEQFLCYKKAAEAMAGKRVVIRTLDIGADKQADYFGLEQEENPAMGCRAIRLCLTRPKLFRTQLRALFRAGSYGRIAVMYPMIVSVEEIRRIREIAEQVKAELTEEGVPFGKVEQGIMIETPAAVMISDLLAKEADFFSIGTNDLSQYTLAIDRQNVKLDPFFDPHHEAILRMIRMVVRNAHEAGIPVEICGELASDLTLTGMFIEMGVDALSVAPSAVLLLRDTICRLP